MIIYHKLDIQDITSDFFDGFIRTQVVTDCFRKINGAWVIKYEPFIDDWSERDYNDLIRYLKNTVNSNGFAVGAFSDCKLKGFATVESERFGSKLQYMELSNLHVSRDSRGQGIGRQLFNMSKAFAESRGALKLYISAHSAIETQAFYKAMGCAEAMEYNMKLVDKEPFDCQLECQL